jgi:hypothetical protein
LLSSPGPSRSLLRLSQEDPTTLQARARFKEGVEAYDKDEYEEARLRFYQAYVLKKHPAVLLNLAKSAAKAGKPLEAAKYFGQFLREATTANAEHRKDAEAGLAEVRHHLGRIEISAPAGTKISLDDQGALGSTPMDPIDVEPGQHTVTATIGTVIVSVPAGQKVEAKLIAPSAPPPPAPVAPRPTATETAPAPADTGTKHTGLFSRPESMAPVYVGLVAAGVGLANAAIFALIRSDTQSKSATVANKLRSVATSRGIEAQGACNNPAASIDFATACSTLRDNDSKVDTDATIANASLIVAGVGLVVGIGWYLLGPKRDNAPTMGKALARARNIPALVPYAGWNNGGIVLVGEL